MKFNHFPFDRDFGAPEPQEKVQEESSEERLFPGVYVYTEEEMKSHGEQEFEKGASYGREEGILQGKKESEQENHHLTRIAMEGILERLKEIEDLKAEYDSQLKNRMEVFSSAVLEKLLPGLMRKDIGNEIIHKLNDIFPLMGHEKIIKLRIHPKFKILIENYIQEIERVGGINVSLDEKISPFSFELLWDSGGAYWSLEDIYKKIEAILTDTIE